MNKTKVATKTFYVTKSRYVESYSCDKKLWMEKNKPLLAKEPTLSDKLNMEDGTKVGVLATTLYKGILVDEMKNTSANAHTMKLLMEGEKYIFEATFIYNEYLVKVDILEKNEDGTYNIIEVKSANSVKKNYLIDVAFQNWVLEKCGLTIRSSYLMHLNKEYVRGEKLDLNEFFMKEDVTEDISLHYSEVEERNEKKTAILKLKSEPKKELGSHCKNPHLCPFYAHCHKQINKDSVQKFSRLSAKKRAVFSALNVNYMKDVSENFELTFRQNIQRIAANNENKIIINAHQIKEFLDSQLVYPLIHLDFEAMVKAVPEYKGYRPNQFMVYQFSVDREEENGKVKHSSYLHLKKSDSRRVMAEKLLKACGVEGSIIVWNKSFEATRIKEMANAIPELREALMALIPRMVDIAVIFQKTWLYHHDMQGSYSIKYVLPYLCPDLDYSSLAVGNGADSQAVYKKLMKGDYGPLSSPKAKEVVKNLTEYNDLDTMAMIRVLRRVQELVAETLAQEVA